MVLAAVFLLIAVRQVGRFNLKIWQIMLGGAVAVLVTGQITLVDAATAVDPDVMLFLFGMFVIGEAIVSSGYLFTICAGLLSALLMNDTLAIIGTPLVLGIARLTPRTVPRSFPARRQPRGTRSATWGSSSPPCSC